ncbi:MAG TPA: 50S ribosomal protein L1 [Armatimonadota bacterium]|nr:50S ribosomal protein L1 [Armatimonadota bacterium]
MGRRSKRYKQFAEKIDREHLYPVTEAVGLVKETSGANFDPTVECAIRLGVDPSKGDQSVRGTLSLPHGTGKTPRVVVFAKGEAVEAAEAAGADRVGAEDLVAEIDGGWDEFDILVAMAEMMRNVGRLGKKLGPRMPNQKAGTLASSADELGGIIKELKAGRVEFKQDRAAILHVAVGKASFGADQLLENLDHLVGAVVRARPASAKGRYITAIAISSSQGPGVKLDLQDALGRASQSEGPG